MAATFGATIPAGTAIGQDGLLRNTSSKTSCETFGFRDSAGVTKKFKPGMISREVTVEFWGGADLSAVSAGAFTAGTLKMVSAKITENNEEIPSGSHTYKSHGT
jgi:hypothetical protein